MIAAVPALGALALTFAAWRVSGVADPRAARRVAARWVTGLLVGAIAATVGGRFVTTVPDGADVEVLGLRLAALAEGWRATAPIVDLLVGLLAVALAPVASHGPRTMSAILRVLACALAVVSLDATVPIAILWTASVYLVLRELHGDPRTRAVGRSFGRYHVPSAVLAVVGSILIATGLSVPAGVVCWLLAIAIREALLPVHGWLPELMARAPLGLVVALVAPQLGVFVHLTSLVENVPHTLAHGLAFVGAVTAVVAAAIGVVQSEARRAAAWLVMSQTGLVAFGLEGESSTGQVGAILAWQVMALATSGFVMTIAALEARRGPLSLARPGGSFERTPRMAVAFLVLGFASVGLPLTLGFVAEDLLVQGSIDEFPILGLALIVATALNGMNVMRCFFALFSGTRQHIGERDFTPLELFAVTTILAVLLSGGLAPHLFVPDHASALPIPGAATSH